MDAKPIETIQMTGDMFELIADLIQSKEPAKTAARMVLIEGKKARDAMDLLGISRQSISNSLGRYRRAHCKICAAYLRSVC